MKFAHMLCVVILSIFLTGGIVLSAGTPDKQGLADLFDEQEQHELHDHEDGHGLDMHEDSGKDPHGGDDHEKHGHEAHAGHQQEESHGGHGQHDEDADMVEMTKAQQEEIGLVVAVARSGDIESILSFVGEVRMHEDRVAHIVPAVPGVVRNVHASLGEKVREGQTLAVIDSPELAQIKADYLERAQNLELSRRTYERKQYLRQENIASEADLLEAESALRNAETMVHSASRKLAVLGFDGTKLSNIAAANGNAFGRYTLTSPIAGTIIAKHITRGEKVGEEEVFTVADLSELWVDLQIPAKDLARVKKGLHVEIASTDGMRAEGTLSLIGPVVSEESRTALGRIVLPNHEGRWMPGIFVKGQILEAAASSAVVLPSEALQNIDGINVVFVPEGEEFKPVEVSIGKSNREKTEIISGLKPGDRYVAKGAFELKAVKLTSGVDAHAGHGH